VLLVHALEMSQNPTALLREVWRVLASGGQLLAVVPNRRGLWARMDTTPFGHGRPYSRSQILSLMRDAWFTPVSWSEALYVPPFQRSWFLRSAVAWERVGATISAPFAGVHIVDATKQVYRAIPARREKRVLVPALKPALAPQPSPAARHAP
jgi:SAM-dependent methyltransferase